MEQKEEKYMFVRKERNKTAMTLKTLGGGDSSHRHEI